MVPTESSVELLAQAILAQAATEAKKTKDVAQGAAERLVSEAEQAAEIQREAAVLAEATRAGRENASALAAVRLKVRRRILDAREELIDRVFGEVENRLQHLRSDAPYERVLIELIQEALSALEGESFIVSITPEDSDVARRALNSASIEGKRVDVRPDEHLTDGGCIVWQSDRRSFYDNTFRAIVARHRLRLRALVAEALWGKDSRWDDV